MPRSVTLRAWSASFHFCHVVKGTAQYYVILNNVVMNMGCVLAGSNSLRHVIMSDGLSKICCAYDAAVLPVVGHA